MIPDLGRYAVAVLSSYGATLVLIMAVVVLTVWQGRRVKRQLEDVEARQAQGQEKTNG